MGILDDLKAGLRALLGQGSPKAVDPPQLDASTKGALGSALDRLGPGERGWITFDDYDRLFATTDGEPAVETMGKFAVVHRCATRREPHERRIYFRKNAT